MKSIFRWPLKKKKKKQQIANWKLSYEIFHSLDQSFSLTSEKSHVFAPMENI